MAYCYACGDRLQVGVDVCAACGATFPFEAWSIDGPDPDVHAAQWAAGRLVASRFRIEAPLARGGMGIVLRTTDLDTDTPVALKTLHPEFLGDASFVGRFFQEADRLKSLHHPRIVRLIDHGEHEGAPFLVMELLAGETAAQRLSRTRRLHWRAATQIAAEACEGLCAIHARGYVHRDIKPSNLMLTERGCVLLDFGVLRVAGTALTNTGATLGTPTYLAPEQGLDPRRADARSDLYSLGVTLFELLTGQVPFLASSRVELLRMHLRDAPPDVATLAPDVPNALSQIVARCLAKRAEDRYESATSLKRTLESVARKASP